MPKRILNIIKDKNIKYVDFRFTDPKGKSQHMTYVAEEVDEEMIKDGMMFDGSSIPGWKEINESDMILRPDPATFYVDPFTAQPTLVVICDIVDPETNAPYERDPRSTAFRAEEYLKSTGLGDTAYFGSEPEFFIFDDVRFDIRMNSSFVQIDSEEGPYNSSKEYAMGNLGHRPRIKGGYFPVPPVDSMNDMRSEMLEMLKQVGLEPVLHHHEVAPSQNELGVKFNTLVNSADNLQRYKYVVHNVAHAYGKTATFMPKPISEDNGSGMHVHQSIWKDGKPLFSGDKYAGLSEMCLYYIGGIIKHIKALNAFTNASTNSYKRLVPGFEAPVLLAYSSRNRSAAIRIPHSHGPKGKRIECRFPDPTANPYYAFSAMLMAGLDGIQNKIHPGEAMDKNLYDLPDEELSSIPSVSRSLRQSLIALSEDREFLTRGGVFNDDQIDAYIELKLEEVETYETTPHPIEFHLYYSV